MNADDSIRRDRACTLMEAGAAAVIHGEMLLLLMLLVGAFPSLFFELLGEFYGALPAEPHFLVAASRHWLIFALCCIVLLAVDVHTYRWLFSRKGHAAPAMWSAAVSTALTMAIISYGWLCLRSLLWIASYRH